LTGRFYLSPKSEKQGSMDRTHKRLYSLLLILIALQLLAIGLLVTRTGGPPEVDSEPLSVTRTVSQVESLVKPTVEDVAIGDSAAMASVGEDREESEQDSLARSLPTRIQVLNGCGVRGIGRRVAPALRERGFDVREIGNAPHFRYDHTLVLDRKGDLARGLVLADSLGIDHAFVRTQIDAKLVDIDLTLIVGRDHAALKLQSRR
jgi:hypothetical protein